MPMAPSIDAQNRDIVTPSAFAINVDYNVKATGYRGTAAKATGDGSTDTDVDFAIGAEDRYINGLHLLLKNHTWDDRILYLRIVDKDGLIPSPARAAFPGYPTLNEFGTNWNVDDTEQDQGANSFSYIARLPAGMYIRIGYRATGVVADVDIRPNFLLHKKIST